VRPVLVYYALKSSTCLHCRIACCNIHPYQQAIVVRIATVGMQTASTLLIVCVPCCM
jgi:hypothetical protein